MARQKKTLTATVTKAESRLSGLKSINEKLDLGGGMSVAVYQKEVTVLRQKIDAYSKMLSNLDKASNELEALDDKVNDLTSRMLAGVLMRYGRDSSEYEMAGGVRRSDRKRKKVQPKMEAVTA